MIPESHSITAPLGPLGPLSPSPSVPPCLCGEVSVPSQLPLQPITDIPAYLQHRRPVPHHTAETPLFVTLPDTLKRDLRTLLGTRENGGAFGHITHLVHTGSSVQRAVVTARALYKIPGSLKRLRARYDLWSKTGDWVSLVNRAKAGAPWQAREDGLALEFLTFCAHRLGKFVRDDGRRQALLSIKRQWLTGRDDTGAAAPIPGYGFWQDWFSREGYRLVGLPRRPLPVEAPIPPGWSYTNILRQIRAANVLPASVRALLHHGTAAARSALPQVHFDRNRNGNPLLFLEQVQFDDVKCDFLIIDPVTGQVCDLWLLVARDLATSILLGFGMRPARTREDGSQEHLRLRDMKQLCGWLLERFGLPPYTVVWKIEHGTATLSKGSRAVLRELLPGRIDVSYSSMIGGASPAGYQQRGLGNSKGKAMLESHNRLMHTMAASLPGQTGPVYSKRPLDLQARVKEATEIWQTTQHLPAHLRNDVAYPLLTLNQAREHLFRYFQIQNQRTEHALQGFEEIAEWYDATTGLWKHQSTFPGRDTSPRCPELTDSQLSTINSQLGGQPQVRRRKESPLERCARLIAPYRDRWSMVSPDIIAAFYEHTARQVVVQPNGLIEFRTDGRAFQFMPPPSCAAANELSTLNPQLSTHLAPGTKLLAYFHPDDPSYLHLTDGQGRALGTWIRRDRATDQDTLTQAIRYSQASLSAAKDIAANFAAPERAALEHMRARNAELLASDTFVAVSEPLGPLGPLSPSPVAASLAATSAERQAAQRATQAEARKAAEAILAPAAQQPAASDAALDDFLSAISKPTR
jgi:hypothetical protein